MSVGATMEIFRRSSKKGKGRRKQSDDPLVGQGESAEPSTSVSTKFFTYFKRPINT